MTTRTMAISRILLVLMLSMATAFVACGDDDPAAPSGGGAPPALSFDNFQAASVVIGQLNMTSRTANAGGTTGAIGFNIPFGSASGSLYVPDYLNNRVMGYNGVPSADGVAADFVIGQVDFTSNTPGTTSQSLRNPVDCEVADGKLFVVDNANNRVLIWNSLPTSNVPADVVVGQPDFTTSTSALTQTSLPVPAQVEAVGGKLIVLSFSAERVLIWNSIPTTNGAPADVVVGAPDFTTPGGGLTQSRFGDPRGLWSDGTRMVVAESENSRVLIWNSIPTTNDQPADVVVGAADFTTEGSNTPSETSIGDPYGVGSDGTSLFVSDWQFNRVLIYTPFPTANGVSATGVLGQSTFTNVAINDTNQDGTNETNPSARTLRGPVGLQVNGSRLLVSDMDNHRVLVYNSN